MAGWILLKLGWLAAWNVTPVICCCLSCSSKSEQGRRTKHQKGFSTKRKQQKTKQQSQVKRERKAMHFLGNIPSFLKILIQSQVKPLEVFHRLHRTSGQIPFSIPLTTLALMKWCAPVFLLISSRIVGAQQHWKLVLLRETGLVKSLCREFTSWCRYVGVKWDLADHLSCSVFPSCCKKHLWEGDGSGSLHT